MGRLIDADKLLKETRRDRDYARKNGFLDMYYERQILIDRIKAHPTAYDQEQVVEQLESELRLADKEKERCARENPLQFDSSKGYAMGLSNAIEIVKAVKNNEYRSRKVCRLSN